jgi:hypothetical protein
MNITKTKQTTISADDSGMTIQFVIADHPENKEYVNLTEGDITIIIPKVMIPALSQALADFKV